MVGCFATIDEAAQAAAGAGAKIKAGCDPWDEKPVREQHKRGEAEEMKTGARGFKQQRSTYRISKAPTGRGRCRRCRTCIDKGSTRLEINCFVRPGRYTLLLRCTDINCLDARLSVAILSVYKNADHVPVDPGLVGSAEAMRVQRAINKHIVSKKYSIESG